MQNQQVFSISQSNNHSINKDKRFHTCDSEIDDDAFFLYLDCSCWQRRINHHPGLYAKLRKDPRSVLPMPLIYWYVVWFLSTHRFLLLLNDFLLYKPNTARYTTVKVLLSSKILTYFSNYFHVKKVYSILVLWGPVPPFFWALKLKPGQSDR